MRCGECVTWSDMETFVQKVKEDLGPAHMTSGEECSRQRRSIMEHLLWKDASSGSDQEAVTQCLGLCVEGRESSAQGYGWFVKLTGSFIATRTLFQLSLVGQFLLLSI